MLRKRRTNEELTAEVGPIARFVRQQRKQLGYTQEEFAWRVGIGIRFLKELEQGKTHLRLDKVNQVIHFLGAELVPQQNRVGG